MAVPHIRGMAQDKFSADLKCPECGREGTAHLWEKDGAAYLFGDKSTHVEMLPEGFKCVDGKSWVGDIDFQCVDHPVSAMVKK